MLETAKHDTERRLDGLSQLQAQMTFRFSVLSKLLDRQMTDIAKQVDLSLTAYRALATIAAFGAISAADLCRYTGYDKAAISRHLAALESAGLIVTSPDPMHRRRKMLSLTLAGEKRIAAARPLVEARRKALSDQITPQEEAVFLSVIDKLATHVDRSLTETS